MVPVSWARGKQAPLMGGTLYLVATPIGNLEDLTFRALRVIRDSGLLLCEDTRHTRKLLQAYGISRSLVSLHKFNERSREGMVMSALAEGRTVALGSDAGSPAISDPGSRLVAAVWGHGYRAESVPGPCSVVAALTASGLPADSFVFLGFVPVKRGQRSRFVEAIASATRTVVFFESPYRVEKLLEELSNRIADRSLVICRELTKRYEQVVRGTVAEVRSVLGDRKPRGEYVFVVEESRGKVDSP